MAGAGDIRIVAFNFVPEGWLLCDGSMVEVAWYRALFDKIGTTYGGDGKEKFGVPDFRGPVVGPSPKFALGKSTPTSRGSSGSDRHPACLALPYIINATDNYTADEPFTGEIRAVGFNYNLRNWRECDGALMPIMQNTALFSLLGDRYGGDVRTTFALPDLRARTPVCADTQHPVGSAFGKTIDPVGTGGEPAFLPVHYLICTAGMYPRRP